MFIKELVIVPKCLKCGNELSFGTSKIPPVAPTANGPVSGLVADFSNQNSIVRMESMGATIDEAQEAWEEPNSYFYTFY